MKYFKVVFEFDDISISQFICMKGHYIPIMYLQNLVHLIETKSKYLCYAECYILDIQSKNLLQKALNTACVPDANEPEFLLV